MKLFFTRKYADVIIGKNIGYFFMEINYTKNDRDVLFMQGSRTEKINISDIKEYLRKELNIKKIHSCKNHTELFGRSSHKKDSFSQYNIISSMIKGKDVLAMMPTGTGKSLCFEIPAICSEGLTIVVSPITALIDSQAIGFNERYKKMITSSSSNADKQEDSVIPRAAYSGMYDLHGAAIINEILTGDIGQTVFGKKVNYKILYVSPERLMQSKFRRCFMAAVRDKGLRVSRIVYDEVHCFSQWGWSFRPSYLGTIRWIKEYESITGQRLPRAGFTATATKADISRVTELLEMKNLKMFLSLELNRNIDIQFRGLFKSVVDDNSDDVPTEVSLQTALNEYLAANGDFEKCIIFCSQKRTVDALVKRINTWTELPLDCADSIGKHKCIKYHAGMDRDIKAKADASFRMENTEADAADILTASIAYGLGINNDKVDLVINYGLAKSFEEYIQMIGRAGRGGKDGKSLLLYKKYSPSDRASMIASAAKVLRWELKLNDSSPINELDEKYKDLLIMLQIYRFCRYKEMIEQCLKLDVTERRGLLEELTYEYFAFDVSDPKNAPEIKGCIKKFTDEVITCYWKYISALDKKTVTENSKEKLESIERKKKSYSEVVEIAQKAWINTKQVIDYFYKADSNKEDGDMYGQLRTILKTPQMLKINNTQVANTIRKNKKDYRSKHRLSLDTRCEITQKERFMRSVITWYRDEDNHGKLVNANIREATGLLYIPRDRINDSYESILSFVDEQYKQWEKHNSKTELKYIYGIEYVPEAKRFISKYESEKYKAYVVRIIWEMVDGEWKLMHLEQSSDIGKNYKKYCEDNLIPIDDGGDSSENKQKYLETHVGADVNVIRITESNKTFQRYTFERQMDNKDPKLVTVKKLRERKISFIISQINELPLDSAERIISYFDMCVFDAVYSLTFEGQNRIYLQSIWRVLSGDPKAVLSGGYRNESGTHGIKTKLTESIEKLKNLRITIEDSQIEGGKIEGVFLPLSPNVTKSKKENGNVFGYILDEMPVLARYAEELNGEFISIPTQKMNIKQYDKKVWNSDNSAADDFTGIRIEWDKQSIPKKAGSGGEERDKTILSSKERFNSVEKISMAHYILHRSAISKNNKSQLMGQINIDNMIDILGDDICVANRNNQYIYWFAEAVLRNDLAGYLQKNGVDIVKYSVKTDERI